MQATQVMFTEDQLLPISALQHMLFCPRQCALIHLEQVWSENKFTVEGNLMHERAHHGTDETRHDIRITRGMPVRSLLHGLSGQCDIVEFHGPAPHYQKIIPVEYKRGKPKAHSADEVQLCAQALCLEEISSPPSSPPKPPASFPLPSRKTPSPSLTPTPPSWLKAKLIPAQRTALGSRTTTQSWLKANPISHPISHPITSTTPLSLRQSKCSHPNSLSIISQPNPKTRPFRIRISHLAIIAKNSHHPYFDSPHDPLRPHPRPKQNQLGTPLHPMA